MDRHRCSPSNSTKYCSELADMVRYVLIFLLPFFNLGESLKSGQCTRSPEKTNIDLNITDGRITGITGVTAEENKPYIAFKGIPYAEPPVKNLRFEPPVAKKPWNGTLNCTYDKSQCIQGSNPVAGSEDCLFINVYTRSLTGKSGVLVFIHGGTFITGNSSETLQGPDHFLNEGLVFVQFNYRLGFFGFISTEDLVVPGNLGLKDQVVALKWIQKNIAFFGGDPKNVTLFGQSAGSSSISYHMQSELSKGLFQRTIMDSGTSLCLWSLARDSRSTAFKIGSTLGIVTNNSTKLITGLKNISYEALQEASSRIYTQVTLNNVLDGFAFGPVQEVVHDGAFFTGKSEEMLRTGNYTKVPSLLGVNSNEAASAKSVSGIIRLFLAQLDVSPTILSPANLNNERGIFQPKRVGANARIKCEYFNCLSISLAPEDKISEFISNDQFDRPVRKTAMDISQYSTTYMYVFSYVGALGGSLNRTLKGVGHTEELAYLFKSNLSNISEDDTLMRRRMVRMWSNFAKYGNPTPFQDPLLQNITWSATHGNNVTYLNIDKILQVSLNPFSDKMEFYDKIYKDFGTPPYSTY
ncbi:juvenile hormone esterase [Leptinotarsa decemlineata]|uniref:juvenile hormone esterase n=1 Tax=Leptinotarsa decemlineata TaxID=7539 RepID=UPI003D304D11